MPSNLNYVILAFGASFLFVSALGLIAQILIDKSVEKEFARMPKTYYRYNISWTSKFSSEHGEVELFSSNKLRDWFMMKEVGKKIEMTIDMFAIISYTESEEIRL